MNTPKLTIAKTPEERARLCEQMQQWSREHRQEQRQKEQRSAYDRQHTAATTG